MSLLSADDPAAFEVVRPNGRSSLFLLCDHAARRLPRALGDLGLPEARLSEHIAWDIGAADLARSLSASFDAPLVLSGYSRLAIDCNRPLDVASSIPEETCGVRVPGNAGLSEDDRAARQNELFWPYHRAIGAELSRRDEHRIRSSVLSVHSFTPSMHGHDRPWHVGVMYGRDRRFAALLLEALTKEGDLVVGDNEPYRVTDGTDYGVPTYAERARRPGVLLEVRQDLIATASGVERIHARLHAALEGMLSALLTC